MTKDESHRELDLLKAAGISVKSGSTDFNDHGENKFGKFISTFAYGML